MKQKIYHYAKEVIETSDMRKVASLLANHNEEWIATDATVQGNGNISVVVIRIK